MALNPHTPPPPRSATHAHSTEIQRYLWRTIDWTEGGSRWTKGGSRWTEGASHIIWRRWTEGGSWDGDACWRLAAMLFVANHNGDDYGDADGEKKNSNYHIDCGLVNF